MSVSLQASRKNSAPPSPICSAAAKTSQAMTDWATWAPPSSFRGQLQEIYGLDCTPRWGLPRRLDYPTYGPAACRVLEALGTPAMPHQRYTLDCALEVDPATGNLWYREVGLSIMRQQGKTQQ